MGYLHISNLYKDQAILALRRCYALEKLHGTSADIEWKVNPSNKAQRQLVFHSGGESYNKFVSLFDKEKLTAALTDLGLDPDKDLCIYGEAYGGSQQGMSATYGTSLKFGVFDIQIGDLWLVVPQADEMAQKLGLEFVPYQECSTDLVELNAQRDLPSVQAIRNGVSTIVGHNVLTAEDGVVDCPSIGRILNPKKREGVVLRPVFEIRLNNNEEAGHRLICKHKGDEFKETATPRPVVDPAKMQMLSDANAVANDWVTATRLEHVLDKLPGHCMERMREIISAVQEDVLREGKGEIVESDAVKKAIGKKTAEMYKSFIKVNEAIEILKTIPQEAVIRASSKD